MKKTIKKVLEELAKDKPDLSYIRGMLEVLIDGEDTIHSIPYIPPLTPSVWTTTSTVSSNIDLDIPPAPDFNSVKPPINE